jgi:hypothetical protein
MNGGRSKTQIDFGEWSAASYDNQVVDQEMQLQHKRKFDEKPPYGIPARPFEKAPLETKTTTSDIGAEQSQNISAMSLVEA